MSIQKYFPNCAYFYKALPDPTWKQCSVSKATLVALVLVLSNNVLAAQPCSDSAYRQWDFWVGQWRVESLDGVHQGNNHISRAEHGCLLIENWRSAQGSTGQSYNFYNPVEKLWRQVWVSQGAIIDYSGGLTDTGAMRLEGTISYQLPPRQRPAPPTKPLSKPTPGSTQQPAAKANSAEANSVESKPKLPQRARFMGLWTPQADGNVLQELKQWDAASQTWKVWFTGLYVKQAP